MTVQPGLCRTRSETRTLVFSRRGSCTSIYFSDDFKTFAQEKPEYAPLFIAYQELKAADTNGNVNGNKNSNAKTRLPVVIEEDNLGPADNQIKAE